MTLPSLIPAAGDTLQAKNITPAYAGLCCTRALHKSRGASLPYPRHQEASAISICLWSCRRAKHKLFLSHKQGLKGTFKHCNFKFMEVSFPCEKNKEDAFLLTMMSASKVPPLFFSPLCDPRSDVVPLGTCIYLSCSWFLAQMLFQTVTLP